MSIHPLRPRDHEVAARVAISWLAERHRKGWRSTFEALLDLWPGCFTVAVLYGLGEAGCLFSGRWTPQTCAFAPCPVVKAEIGS